jgi:serine/threonine-protein kinase
MALRPTIPFSTGDVIAGKYRVGQVLGAGGMGVVVEAYHEELEQRVALKVMLAEVASGNELATRFVREARASGRLQSEHIVKVFDVGRLETGQPYIVMEYLDGSDLAAVVRAEGAQPIERSVDWVLQACEAIAEAHTRGIVHRDLKPSNIFITRRVDGSAVVKVLDFGISKVLSSSASPEGSLTGASVLLGSPAYMSPEQMRNARTVDWRADVWGLGAILYEVLTGERPFEADSLAGLVLKVATETATPLREHRADVPAKLEEAVLRCLEKDVERRTPNVAALAASLEPFASREGTASVRRSVRVMQAAGMARSVAQLAPSGARSASSAEDESDAPRTVSFFGIRARGRRGRVAAGVLASGLVLAVGGVTTFWWAGRTGAGPEPAPSGRVRSAPSIERTTVDDGVLPLASSAPLAASSAPPSASAAAQAPAAALPGARSPVTSGRAKGTKTRKSTGARVGAAVPRAGEHENDDLKLSERR